MTNIHPDFVSLEEFCPGVKIQADYSTVLNFTGEIVPGYKAQKAFIAKAPAEALKQVQLSALGLGLSLNIFDAYRPVKAEKFFKEWAQLPESNPEMKELYYPTFTRLELFKQGFIAEKSSHTRGSAVDLTLFDLKTGQDLDMGSRFDFFDEISHTHSSLITAEQKKNRMLLKDMLELRGFVNYWKEWWHFSYKPEPFPEQYFDFDII
jgi:D-alanyl-D-alanine dipeptidase